MAALGVESEIDISPLSVFGFTEGLMALPAVYECVRLSVDLIMKDVPSAVVLIDSWGFTIACGARIGEGGI